MKREQKNDYFCRFCFRDKFSLFFIAMHDSTREKNSNKRITNKMRRVKLKEGDSQVRGLFRWLCFSSVPLNGGCQVIHSPSSSTAPLHQCLSVLSCVERSTERDVDEVILNKNMMAPD